MSPVEIRPARAEEMAEFTRQAARQLALPETMLAGMPPEWTLAAFVDGTIATTYAWWPLQLRLAGRAVRVAGVTQISTHPAHRRRGFLRAVTRAHFEKMHALGEEAFAGLHPAWVEIYQRYGYGSVTVRHTYRVAPRDIRFHHPISLAGRIREIDPAAEFSVLVDIYRRYREDRTGLVHRGRAMWGAGALQSPPAGHQGVVLIYEEAGEALGHIAYSHGRTASGIKRLNITDLFALTPAAHQALWSCVGGYDNVDEIVWDNAPADDPLPLMLVEPRRLNQSVRDGIMIRLVSVGDAMAQRPYATITELRFRLIDRFCEWNDGSWCVATSPVGGTAARIDGRAVDFILSADTLAAILFGRYSPSQAYRAGLIMELSDHDTLQRWDAACRLPHQPHEAEHTW